MPDVFGARRLTDLLLAPVQVPDDLFDAVRPVPEMLASHAAPGAGAGPRRVTDHDVQMALAPVPPPVSRTPFAWSARTARRALGLHAVRALVAAEVRSPIGGVRAAISRAAQVGSGGRPTSTMDAWLAGLPPAAQASVEAAAVTWATRLWTALDWKAFPTPPTIGRDHWWDSPHTSLLALRGRAEVRALLAPRDLTAAVHLVVLGGTRRPSIRSELCVVALVEALRAQWAPAPVPGRVVGWWPDSGHVVHVEVNGAALEEGAASVVRTLAAGSARPGHGGAGRASQAGGTGTGITRAVVGTRSDGVRDADGAKEADGAAAA